MSIITRAITKIISITANSKKINIGVYNGIPEAPDDGNPYVRKSKNWAATEGGTVEGTVTETSSNPVKSSGIWAWVMNIVNNLLSSVSSTANLTGDGTTSEPLDLNSAASPTLADLKIPALSQDDSYDAATLAYLNSLFATLSDSVKENFLRVWGRLAVADDNLIYEDILTEKAYRIEITVDKNGNPLSETNILVLVDTNYVDDDDLPLSARNIVEINGITSGYSLATLMNVSAFQPSYSNSERMYYYINFVALQGLVYMNAHPRRGVTLDAYRSLDVLENETITDINSIVIRTSGPIYNAAGTKIKIYRQ